MNYNRGIEPQRMHTLVPIGTFEKKARRLLGGAGFDELMEFLARHPTAGSVIQGTGGLRKVRSGRSASGKSGGVRVIYYYHSENKPILLLLIYSKTERENLTAIQKAQLKRHVDVIFDEFG